MAKNQKREFINMVKKVVYGVAGFLMEKKSIMLNSLMANQMGATQSMTTKEE